MRYLAPLLVAAAGVGLAVCGDEPKPGGKPGQKAAREVEENRRIGDVEHERGLLAPSGGPGNCSRRPRRLRLSVAARARKAQAIMIMALLQGIQSGGANLGLAGDGVNLCEARRTATCCFAEIATPADKSSLRSTSVADSRPAVRETSIWSGSEQLERTKQANF